MDQLEGLGHIQGEASPSASPVQAKIPMDFSMAIRRIIEGKRITKREWRDRDTFGMLKDGLLVLHLGGQPQDEYHAWLVSDGDLLGLDWVVL